MFRSIAIQVYQDDSTEYHMLVRKEIIDFLEINWSKLDKENILYQFRKKGRSGPLEIEVKRYCH